MDRQTIGRGIRIAATVLGVVAGASGAYAQDDLLSGEWSGTYRCAQGLTALTLTIAPEGEQWTGVFAFGPDKSNKYVPHGSYDLVITEAMGTFTMVPGAWIEQPPDYISVALAGELSDDLMTLSGSMEHESCQTFETTRTTPQPEPTAPKTK